MGKIESTPPPLPQGQPPEMRKSPPSGPFSGLAARISSWFKKDRQIPPLVGKSIQPQPTKKTSGLPSFLRIFKASKSEQKDTVRANMIAHLESITGKSLTRAEMIQVDKTIATLEKIDKSM